MHIDKCVFSVYCIYKGDIIEEKNFNKKLESVGFRFERHGGNHDIYVYGENREEIPRHKEINERLARAILKKWGL